MCVKRTIGLTALTVLLIICLSACAGGDKAASGVNDSEAKASIEKALDLSNMGAEWTYSEDSDAWTMTPVTAVADPQIKEEQGVSVCVPGPYVKGLDTDGDGQADKTSGTAAGDLIIDSEARITSSNGQVYTALTAPVIINTGAAGYSEQENPTAADTYAAEGYVNVACGNRGKQSKATDENGDTVFTGDAPCCLVDQKNAVRFVKYNILLGNLPGSIDYFVSTGGSGGGAHAVMLAATSDHPDFYPYEVQAGAVGVYESGNGYETKVTINGEERQLSDGIWGCMAYSPITSLQEADMAMAFEYNLDQNYTFNTSFQKQTAEYLAREYMNYINGRELKVKEETIGFDLDGDGEKNSTVDLSIEYDKKKYAQTNGYGGTYLDLYLSEFEQSLQDYLDRLDHAEDWTWFDDSGQILSDSETAALTSDDRAEAFVKGHYAKGSSSDRTGDLRQAPGAAPGGDGGSSEDGGPPEDGVFPGGGAGPDNSSDNANQNDEKAGTPEDGTTQSAGSRKDSSSYDSFETMLDAYRADIAAIQSGDSFGNNIVDLYDPIRYIGAEETSDPVWTRMLLGASEGDISMMNSLNLQVSWLNAGTDAQVEWQWDGGHVPSEILGDSLPLYVDMMYGKYVDGAREVTRAEAEKPSGNGDAQEATGTDLSDWVHYDPEEGVSFSLADAAAYRTAGAAKAVPGFDVIDYGQEDYEFGDASSDARHWNKYVLKVFEEKADILTKLFNAEDKTDQT